MGFGEVRAHADGGAEGDDCLIQAAQSFKYNAQIVVGYRTVRPDADDRGEGSGGGVEAA